MIVRGRDLEKGFDDKCDVVVVGSGAGGAVVATLCAEAGLDVVILEEGGYYSPEEYGRFRPSESLRRLGRESGLFPIYGVGDTPVISLMQGKAVGGSSLMTGGVCFRIPDDVLHRWATELGLDDLAPEQLAPHFEEVEKRIHVEEVPTYARSRSTELFVEGAAKMGIPMYSMRRNTSGCEGRARCTFGCSKAAKMSVDLSYLPSARERGARIYADCRVDDVLTTNGRASGVSGVVLGGRDGQPVHKFRVHAKVVVIAGGTVHTPMILWRAGIGTNTTVLGNHITLHPSFRVSAIFDEDVRGWDGVLQSVYSDHFMDDGITLVGIYSAVNVLAAALPGVGREHLAYVKKMRNGAFFGGMIHDEGGGSVRPHIGREPLLSYRMAAEDKRRLVRGVGIVSEMAFAAGAKEVIVPWFGYHAFRRVEDLRDALANPPDASRMECISFHPLGSARMGVNSRLGVVRPSGESWDLEGLYVADGSVLPTSIGVNSQLPVMAVATKIARGLIDEWSRFPPG
ncbi:MAG: GMC family oxidoreductase [Deltaproteobacteria bacterium]|nr:GMC family oxidoreductase [Deltaproteobacteria bacterium]